jgi:hypothetical protein
MASTPCAFVDINPHVKYVGVSKLRDLNASRLREQTEDTFVIQENDTPLSVLLSYKKYLEMREEFNAMLSMIEVLANENERSGLLAAFEDLKLGRVRSLTDIEADLEKQGK